MRPTGEGSRISTLRYATTSADPTDYSVRLSEQ